MVFIINLWVPFLDIICFEDTDFGSVEAFERGKKMECVHRGHLLIALTSGVIRYSNKARC